MREEYDFSKGERGKYSDRLQKGIKIVVLEPDVAEVFADSDEVNEALRSVARTRDGSKTPRKPVDPPGVTTSPVEVTNISKQGFWLLLDDRELFLRFEQFPWFKGASVEAILGVERPKPEHLYWPKLDVDLTVESIEHPERFPLKAKV